MSAAAPDIFIVLSAFNGSAYLAAQIESLRAQSLVEWQLLVADDHSSDHSREIIAGFAQRDQRICLMEPAGARLGPVESYSRLLAAARDRGAQYVFCADQDDVWEPGKLEAVMGHLTALEGAERAPALVHHDLRVVDEQLAFLADSLWGLMALKPHTETEPTRLLSRNEVTGCALACNRALLDLALPIPEQAIMHDWWLALHAAFLGRLRPLEEALVRYRQHGENVIGAKSYRAGLNPFANWRRTWKRGNDEFLATTAQASAFNEVISGSQGVEPDLMTSVRTYAELPTMGPWARLGALRSTGVWRKKWLLDAVLALRVLFIGRENRP